MNELIKALTEQDTKTLSQKALKVCEESGELAKVILPFDDAAGTKHRFVDKQQILEQVVDVHLCAMSIAYSLGFTDDDIHEMLSTKVKKWADIQQREAKLSGNIPYEIHITVANAEKEHFIAVCKAYDIKPIIINLQKTDGSKVFDDVMTSSVHMGTNRSAYNEMCRISQLLKDEGCNVVREKIETVPWHPAAPTKKSNSVEMPENCYFESHIGVNIPADIDLGKLESLKKLAAEFNVHYSRNAFKVHDDGSYMQMLTFRLYKGTFEEFEETVNFIYNMIACTGFDIEKRITEFSIYDTKVSHDAKWILD